MARMSQAAWELVQGGVVGEVGRAPEPPAELSDAEAAVWREAVSDLAPGHLRNADLLLLAQWCWWVVEVRRLQARYAEEVAEGRVDGDVAAGLLDRAGKASLRVEALASKCRLSASASTRIDTGANKRRDTVAARKRPWAG